MSVPRIRLETVEAIARKILMEYDSSLLSGEPRPIPIEAIIEVKFDLILEYHILRKMVLYWEKPSLMTAPSSYMIWMNGRIKSLLSEKERF